MLFENMDLIDLQLKQLVSLSPKQLIAFQAEKEIESILDDLELVRKEINNV